MARLAGLHLQSEHLAWLHKFNYYLKFRNNINLILGIQGQSKLSSNIAIGDIEELTIFLMDLGPIPINF